VPLSQLLQPVGEAADEEVKRLPRFVGSVDQLTNVVCVRDWPNRRAGLADLYRIRD
jgi:hypothetical protein